MVTAVTLLVLNWSFVSFQALSPVPVANEDWQWNALQNGLQVVEFIDLDGDSVKELILLSGADSRVRAAIVETDLKTIRCSIDSGDPSLGLDVRLADIDDDQSLEVFVADRSSLNIYNSENCQLNLSIDFEELGINSLDNRLIDIDSDGVLELLQIRLEDSDNRLVLSSALNPLNSISDLEGVTAILAIDDLDSIDGQDAIIRIDNRRIIVNGSSLTESSEIYSELDNFKLINLDGLSPPEALYATGTPRQVKIVNLISGDVLLQDLDTASSFVRDFFPVDIDSDGVHEVLTIQSRRIQVFDQVGTLVGDSDITPYDASYATLLDLDGDGITQTLASITSTSGSWLVDMPLFSNRQFENSTEIFRQPFYPLQIGDYNGDGESEYLVSIFNMVEGINSPFSAGGFISLDRNTGSELWRQKLDAGFITGEPSSADLNNDGVLEVCFGVQETFGCAGFNGGFEEWRMPIDAANKKSWILDIDSDDELDVLTQHGNTMTAFSAVEGTVKWEYDGVLPSGSVYVTDQGVWFGSGEISRLSLLTGELITECDNLFAIYFQSEQSLFYRSNGSGSFGPAMGLFDQENCQLGPELNRISPINGVLSVDVSPGDEYFFIRRDIPEDRVFSTSLGAIYSVPRAASSASVDEKGRVLLFDGHGVRRYSSEQLDIFFRSGFESINYIDN